MRRNEILQETRAFLGQFISVEVADDVDVFASGLVNSLFAMQLVLFIESEFAVKVENDDLDYDNFRTLNAIAGFVERKRSHGGACTRSSANHLGELEDADRVVGKADSGTGRFPGICAPGDCPSG